MIFYSQPYDTNKDIGSYYNKFMNLLPDNATACFTDGDTIFTTSDYGHRLQIYLDLYTECGLFTCKTNRVKCQHQLAYNWNSEHMANHREFAQTLKSNFSITDITNEQLFSGVMIMIRKQTWKKIGPFKSGMLGVDNDIHQKAKDHNKPVYLMNGIYLYHWYRGGHINNTSHLK